MKTWDDYTSPMVNIEDVIRYARESLLVPRQPRPILYPANFVMTPIGPMPIEMRDKLQARIKPKHRKDRGAWMKALKKS